MKTVMFIRDCFSTIKDTCYIVSIDACVEAVVLNESGDLKLLDGTIITGVNSDYYAEIDKNKVIKYSI